MGFEYKCVAGPTIVAVRHAKVRDQAVKAFEDIMNEQANEGWEYVGIDEFHVSEPQGFLSGKRIYVPSKILVFRRLKQGSAVSEALKAQALKTMIAPMMQQDSSPTTPNSALTTPTTPSLRAIAETVKSGHN